MLKYSSKNIQLLPVDILLNIFEYLSPKDLGTCLLVSKQWHDLASDDKIWRKVFKKYHINLPSGNIKDEYLRRSKEYLQIFISRHIKHRRIKHLFPFFIDIKKLEIAIVTEIFNKKGISLLRYGKKIDSFSSECDINMCLNFQRKIELRQFPNLSEVDSLEISLSIPALIKTLIPPKDAIRIHAKIEKKVLSNQLKLLLNGECQCYQKIQQTKNQDISDNIMEWHICINQFLIGLWINDRSVAYCSYHISLLEVQLHLERILNETKEISKLSRSVVLGNGKKSKKSSNQFANFMESKFILPSSQNDLKCRFSIENIEPQKVLHVNVWRSLDYIKDLPINLIKKSNVDERLKLCDDFNFKPVIGCLHMNCKNMVKIGIELVNSNNDPLWSHCSCVILTLVTSNNVDYNYCRNELTFNNSIIKGSMVHDDYRDLYLIELTIL